MTFSLCQSSIEVTLELSVFLSVIWASVFLKLLWGQHKPLTYNPLSSKDTTCEEGFRAESIALWERVRVCVSRTLSECFFFYLITVERPPTFRSWDTEPYPWNQNQWLFFLHQFQVGLLSLTCKISVILIAQVNMGQRPKFKHGPVPNNSD